MRPAKKIANADEPFLKSAAAAIGTALGKLAVKTGVATPAAPPAKKSATQRKKLASSAKARKSNRRTVKEAPTT